MQVDPAAAKLPILALSTSSALHRKKAEKGLESAKQAALKLLSSRAHSRKEVGACSCWPPALHSSFTKYPTAGSISLRFATNGQLLEWGRSAAAAAAPPPAPKPTQLLFLMLPASHPQLKTKLLERGHELHDVRDALDRLEAVGLQVRAAAALPCAWSVAALHATRSTGRQWPAGGLAVAVRTQPKSPKVYCCWPRHRATPSLPRRLRGPSGGSPSGAPAASGW